MRRSVAPEPAFAKIAKLVHCLRRVVSSCPLPDVTEKPHRRTARLTSMQRHGRISRQVRASCSVRCCGSMVTTHRRWPEWLFWIVPILLIAAAAKWGGREWETRGPPTGQEARESAAAIRADAESLGTSAERLRANADSLVLEAALRTIWAKQREGDTLPCGSFREDSVVRPDKLLEPLGENAFASMRWQDCQSWRSHRRR